MGSRFLFCAFCFLSQVGVLCFGQEALMRQEISYLVDTLGDRSPASRGDSLSCNHITSSFAERGLICTIMPFDIAESLWGEGTLFWIDNGNKVELSHGEDFSVSSRSASDSLVLPAAIVNGKMSELQLQMLSDRIVLARLSTGNQGRGLPTIQAFEAAGARAVIWVLPPHTAVPKGVSNGNRNSGLLGIPVLTLSNDSYSRIIPSDYTICQSDTALILPSSFLLGVNTHHFEHIIRSANVCGHKKGLIDRYIVIGAHYDTLPSDPGSEGIRPGANDNASGVAMLIALSERLRNVETNHHILFVAFGGEEKGALGSSYFVNNPPCSLLKIDRMINIDMVGRMNNNTLFYKRFNDSEVIPKSSFNTSILLKEGEDGLSDHYDFVKAGIATDYFNTGNDSMNHSSGDISERINFQGMVDILNFLFEYIKEVETRIVN